MGEHDGGLHPRRQQAVLAVIIGKAGYAASRGWSTATVAEGCGSVSLSTPRRPSSAALLLYDPPRTVRLDARAMREPIQLQEMVDLALAGGDSHDRRTHQPARRMTENADRVSELVSKQRDDRKH